MSTATSNVITLRGSTDIVKEFFHFSVNSILYQRGVYPPESFKRASNYGLTMMVTTDEDLIKYLNNISAQLEAWLLARSIQKLVLVVKGMETKETLERWVFDVECTSDQIGEDVRSDKPLKEVTQEIQAIIRQITASVTFLPILDEPCSFDILIYADKEATVPVLWEDSDPCYIENGQKVSLRSFNTKVHKVDVSVSYKLEDFAV